LRSQSARQFKLHSTFVLERGPLKGSDGTLSSFLVTAWHDAVIQRFVDPIQKSKKLLPSSNGARSMVTTRVASAQRPKPSAFFKELLRRSVHADLRGKRQWIVALMAIVWDRALV
jgi:hypothetical protein